MIIPDFIKQSSNIGITCPSGYVSSDRVANAVKIFEDKGYNVKKGNTIGKEYGYFAGTDAERLADLQAMLDDSNIDAILMGRGGYGMSRIIDELDFTSFVKNPKWLCGFSDITVLHNHIHTQYGIATLHSPMCGHFKPETLNEDFIKSFFSILHGHSFNYYAAASDFNKLGECEGLLTGGNLALMTHLIGTNSEVDTNGKILFIEDVGEYLYSIDRMLMQLKRAGKLDNLKGLIFGGFTDLKDTDRPYGQKIEEILHDKIKEYNYPVCFNFPCGHQEINYALAMGIKHKLIVSNNGAELICNL